MAFLDGDDLLLVELLAEANVEGAGQDGTDPVVGVARRRAPEAAGTWCESHTCPYPVH